MVPLPLLPETFCTPLLSRVITLLASLMVLLGVKGNDLLIYDTNMKSEPLKLMHTIPLKGVTDFSTTSLMGEILKGYTFRFTSDGFTYSFKNCRRQAFLDVLQQEISK